MLRSTERELRRQILERPDSGDARLVYADWLQSQGHPQGELISVMMAETNAERLEREAELRNDPHLWPDGLHQVVQTPRDVFILPRAWRICDQLDVEWEHGLAREMWIPPVVEGAAARSALQAHGWSLKRLVLPPSHLGVLDLELPCLEELVIDVCDGLATGKLVLPKDFHTKRIRVQGLPTVSWSVVHELAAMRGHAFYLDVYAAEATRSRIQMLASHHIGFIRGVGNPLVGPAVPRTELTVADRFCVGLARHIAWRQTNELVGRDVLGGLSDHAMEETLQAVKRRREAFIRACGLYVPPADGFLHDGRLLAFYSDHCTADGILGHPVPSCFDEGDWPHPWHRVEAFQSSRDGRVEVCWIPPDDVARVDDALPYLAIEYACWIRRGAALPERSCPDWLLDLGGA